MKKGNVIATGGKGGTVKESGREKRTERVLSAGLKGGLKGKADAKVNLAEQKFLSVAQVALRWGSSETTVRRLIEEGKLNGIRLRHACRLSLVSVVKYEQCAHF